MTCRTCRPAYGSWSSILLWNVPAPDPWPPPFSSRGLLVGAHDRAVDHEICVVPIGGQRGEYPLPHTGMTPSAKTAMDRLP